VNTNSELTQFVHQELGVWLDENVEEVTIDIEGIESHETAEELGVGLDQLDVLLQLLLDKELPRGWDDSGLDRDDHSDESVDASGGLLFSLGLADENWKLAFSASVDLSQASVLLGLVLADGLHIGDQRWLHTPLAVHLLDLLVLACWHHLGLQENTVESPGLVLLLQEDAGDGGNTGDTDLNSADDGLVAFALLDGTTGLVKGEEAGRELLLEGLDWSLEAEDGLVELAVEVLLDVQDFGGDEETGTGVLQLGWLDSGVDEAVVDLLGELLLDGGHVEGDL